MLKYDRHNNYKLQKAYDTFGIPELDILEICDIQSIKDREVYWIEKENALVFGLNIRPGGDDILVGEKHPMSKYTNAQILEVVALLGIYEPEPLTHKYISDQTQVSDATIKDIVSGRTHLWVKEEYPGIYSEMLLAKEKRKIHSLDNLNPFANKKVEQYPPLLSPEGKVYLVEHLTNFCLEHGLQ